MNKDFKRYNDYELLYLIKEGSQEAYDTFLDKYDLLIFKIVSRVYPYGDKMMDLVQEGRMVLFKCIETYKEQVGTSFFSYFHVCLNRRIYNLINKDHYYNSIVVSECENIGYSNDLSKSELNIHKGSRYFDDEIKISIFDECVVGSLTIKEFANNHNMKYSRAYSIYKDVISRLKKEFFY